MKEKNRKYESYFKEYSLRMIIRCIFSSIMYSADRLIAAMIIGAEALVATTIISPLMFIVAGVSSLFIGGMGAYIGLLIGRGKNEKANHIASGILVIMGIIGVFITIPCILFSQEFAKLLGARGNILILSQEYLRYFALSFSFLLVAKGLDVLILNDGSPKYSFNLNIITTIANLGLNLLMVAVFRWGIKGLAIATVISTFIQLIGGILYFIRKSKVIYLQSPRFDFQAIKRICYNGFSDFTMMIVEAFMVFIINKAFIKYLTEMHFEAYAAASIIITLFYGIHMGATMGIQPILSQFMGNGKFESLSGLLNYCVRRTIIYAGIAYIVLIPFIEWILILFIKDPETLILGRFFYLSVGFATMFSNLPLQASIFFTAINRPLESAVISTLRTLIFIPLFAFLSIMVLKSWGVAVGFILSDIILIVGILMYLKRTDLSTLKVVD